MGSCVLAQRPLHRVQVLIDAAAVARLHHEVAGSCLSCAYMAHIQPLPLRQLHSNGAVGLMLVPHQPQTVLPPATRAAMVRMLLGCDRMGLSVGRVPESHLIIPEDELAHELWPSPALVEDYKPPPLSSPEEWHPAIVTPLGLSAWGGDGGQPQAANELPVMMMDGDRDWERLWPAMKQGLEVSEKQRLLLTRACVEQGGVFGMAMDGWGVTVAIEVSLRMPCSQCCCA